MLTSKQEAILNFYPTEEDGALVYFLFELCDCFYVCYFYLTWLPCIVGRCKERLRDSWSKEQMVTCSVLLGVDKGDIWTKVVVGKEDWSWALRVANIGLLCKFN